jgi:hypothetical protein
MKKMPKKQNLDGIDEQILAAPYCDIALRVVAAEFVPEWKKSISE